MANIIASGQLAATTQASFVPVAPNNTERLVSVRLANTSGSLPQTVTLTMTHSGGTATRLWKGTIPVDGNAFGVVALGVADVILGATTTASTVDYTVSDVTDTKASPTGFTMSDGTGAAAFVGTTGRAAVQTIAATGSLISDAAALIEGDNWVTGADATKGVILPVGVAGMHVRVKNDDAANGVLKLWPQTGAKINALTASNAMSLAAKVSCEVWCYSSTQWFTIPLLPS